MICLEVPYGHIVGNREEADDCIHDYSFIIGLMHFIQSSGCDFFDFQRTFLMAPSRQVQIHIMHGQFGGARAPVVSQRLFKMNLLPYIGLYLAQYR